jgi:(E)-2-((N-methylformamido)methylene)succinate hydrolase
VTIADVRGTGSDLVLLHGVGLDHQMWRRCIGPLAMRHRVLSLDLPGHGQAPRVREPISLAGLADRVAAQIPGRVHLAGFSLGALIAQQLALSRSDRIASLMLISSVANRSAEQASAVRERMQASERDFAAAARAAISRWMTPAWQRREPELAEEVLATLLRNDHASYLACYRVFATSDRELWSRLSAITVPTLCITGSEDTGSTPAMTEALAAALPRARAVVIPGARHLLPLEHPDALTAHMLAHTEEVDHERAAPRTL